MRQEERLHAMSQFKAGSCRYLISTNLSARGIDVHELALVIHASMPLTVEDYIHRTGRTGRNGAIGKSILLMKPVEKEARLLLEQELGFSFIEQVEPVVSLEQQLNFYQEKKIVEILRIKKRLTKELRNFI